MITRFQIIKKYIQNEKHNVNINVKGKIIFFFDLEVKKPPKFSLGRLTACVP